MIRIITYLILLVVCPLSAAAQVSVTGSVVEKESREPLVGASVIIKGPDGKIKKYATSKADGSFTLSIPATDGCRLEVTMISFAKRSLPLDSITLPVTIEMEPGATILKEVTVKADRIREQGDTITYDVTSFAQGQDGSIGDVLGRMPGISVESSGKVQYQGKDINRFYIEGSDLLGGKYGIATNGISHSDVGSVEVMENHQPMQVLSGVAYSDQAAINLRLKDKAKATWNVSGSAAAGYSHQPAGGLWKEEFFAMAAMPGFQNITTLKTNNTGDDLSNQANDFFAERRGTDLTRYVGVSLPGVPSLNKERTLFNRSALVSTNNLWKFGRGELKAQIDYTYNRVASDASNITTYFLSQGNRVVTENRSGVDRSQALSAKVIYELNQKTSFINDTLKANLNRDNVTLDVSGSLTNDQSASLPDYYIANDFKLIQRIRGNHLITILSKNEWESMPQTLSTIISSERSRQRVRDHAFYTDESIGYSFTFKGITVGLEGGVKGYIRSLNTALTGLPDLTVGPESTESFTNVLSTNYFSIYATPKLEYWLRRVNFKLNLPLSFAHYTFDKALANRSEAYFSPSLSVNWKPNNRISMGLRGGSGRSPMDLSMIQPGYVMTNYRSFRRGVDDFYNNTSQNLSANVSFKHTRRGVFANAIVLQSWSQRPYTLAQQLYGDYVLYSYSPASSKASTLFATANVGKTLDFMRGSANLNGSFNRSESHLLSESQAVNSVSSAWSVGAKINGSPLRWLSFDYSINYSSSRLAISGSSASWLGCLENSMTLSIVPYKNWRCKINGEHYLNEIATDTYKHVLLVDAEVSYSLSKHIGLTASLSNIFNHRTYYYKTYNQLNSFESLRWLRGRELLITISFKK